MVRSLVLLALLVVTGVIALAQDAPRALTGLPRVALEVTLAPDVRGLQRDIEQRMQRALQAPLAPALVRDSPDRLRLVAKVRTANASELRGFWLPFSGTYAIGDVRLEVERTVILPGPTGASATTVPAIVWQAERLIAGPWRQAEAEIGGAVDELLATFLKEYRQAASVH